jgi:diazepam-binding inhibitor (GABA receptor modulating acyl-CoA-binding protein)
MSDQEALFKQAALAAKSLPERPDNDTLLQLYALFKQGSVGNIQGDRPGFFDFVGAAKYEAWEKLMDTPTEDAQSRYIELVQSLSGED